MEGSKTDNKDYKQEIDNLIGELEGIKYDSVIIIFGMGTGEYLEALVETICPNNKVIIFEPNKQVYESYELPISEQIELVLYEKTEVKSVLYRNINFLNFNRIYLQAFGDYAQVYKEEYEELKESLESAYMNAGGCLSLAHRFREIFVKNMISNLEILKESTPINEYVNSNENVPAIIVSAGPSLDKNIEDMLKVKDQLKNCFIITGSRTVGTLVEHGIIPDIIISVDPVEANYEMMKDYLDLEVPLAFYEYSNGTLLKQYKGPKLYIATLFSKTIEELRSLRGAYLGGSVAHACIDMAYVLGCSPILLVGQDLAYTEGKHHSDSATYSHDQACDHTCNLVVNDIEGKPVRTTITLNLFRQNLESYIAAHEKKTDVKFINCSYGAAIKGAPHEAFDKAFDKLVFSTPKVPCRALGGVNIDSHEIIKGILEHLQKCIDTAKEGLEICETVIKENKVKSLVDVEDDDLDLQRILYVLDIVQTFENSSETAYLGGYFNKFMFDIKDKVFNKLAEEYNDFTSDLQHQARSFKVYFEDMSAMLEEVKKLIMEIVTEKVA